MPAANSPTSPDPALSRSDKTPLSQPRRAIFSWTAIVAFLVIAVGGLTLDLWSKDYVFHKLLSKEDVVRYAELNARSGSSPEAMLWDLNKGTEDARSGKLGLAGERVLGKVKFSLSTNPGVVFGLAMPRVLVAIVSIITILLVFFFFASGDARAWIMHIALAFILAGAMGNLYDRLFSTVRIPGMEQPIVHQVRDFIDLGDIYIGPLNYPWIFNVADVLLVLGVLLLIVNWFFHRKDGGSKDEGRRAKGETAKT